MTTMLVILVVDDFIFRRVISCDLSFSAMLTPMWMREYVAYNGK